MLIALCLVSMMAAVGQVAEKSAALPATPQGRHVQAYFDAFNTGDEKTFLAAQEKLMAPELLKKRPAEERATMFQRMRGNFGTLKVARVMQASATQIRLAVATPDPGDEATFTFTFEEAAPYRITSIAVDVDRRDRGQ